MVRRSKGIRGKSRHILQKHKRERGLQSITRHLREYPDGTTVAVNLDPASHVGMPHLRFQGLTGVIAGRQGHAYVVKLYHGNKPKIVIANPEHLKVVS